MASPAWRGAGALVSAPRHDHQPPLPEWAPHEAVWIGFPSDPDLWEDDLAPAQAEVAAFAGAVHADGEGEEVWLVAADEAAAAKRARLAPFAKVIVEPFGDIWLRDTGRDHRSGAARTAARRASASTAGAANMTCPATTASASGSPARAGLPYAKADWILEGGAIDGDGIGHRPHHRAMPAQSQPQSRPRQGRSRGAAAARPRRDRVVWLGDGLLNDHTDGHVDNLARFVAPGPRRHSRGGRGRSQRGCLCRCGRGAARCRPRGRRHPLARPGRARRRDHPGELHELLHRQRGGGRPAIWRGQRRGRGRGDPGPVPRPQVQSAFAPTIS